MVHLVPFHVVSYNMGGVNTPQGKVNAQPRDVTLPWCQEVPRTLIRIHVLNVLHVLDTMSSVGVQYSFSLFMSLYVHRVYVTLGKAYMSCCSWWLLPKSMCSLRKALYLHNVLRITHLASNDDINSMYHCLLVLLILFFYSTYCHCFT